MSWDPSGMGCSAEGLIGLIGGGEGLWSNPRLNLNQARRNLDLNFSNSSHFLGYSGRLALSLEWRMCFKARRSEDHVASFTDQRKFQGK
jgi:hypothetical protein